MGAKDTGEEMLRNGWGIIRDVARMKMDHFHESVNECGDGVKAVGCFQKVSDEVHADA